jgi:predicted phosphohydrolase
MGSVIHAIGDLHFPGDSGKTMELFGAPWRDHPAKIARDWDARVGDEDVVLVPGDISWAMRLDGAMGDLDWFSARPGRKLLVRGNHDYWWGSIRKVRGAIPRGCHAIQNDAWVDDALGIGVAGARMWDMPGLDLGDIFEGGGAAGDREGPPQKDPGETERIFAREIGRLEASLRRIPDSIETRIAMLHYPPTNPSLDATPVTDLLERFGVSICVFGHLHALRPGVEFGGERRGVRYALVSADYTDFRLVEVLRIS